MTTNVRTFRQAINEALREEMKRDPSVLVMGEDVGRHGGSRGVTRGLFEEFGSGRVMDTPISEMAMSGAAVGLAFNGFRPVIETYFGDILMFMADNLVTSAARLHFATSGTYNAPLVVRGGDGSRLDGGPHQDTLGVWFAHVPGLKVVIPATPADAKGLMASAIRDDNPVIYLEPLRLYDTEGPVPEGEYVVPIGKADIKAEGHDLTLVTAGGTLAEALAARGRWAEKGVSLEVVDLRTLRPLDVDTIRQSVGKTGRLVVVHEGWATYGISAEVVACVAEGPEVLLKAPAGRVTTRNTHVPSSVILAKAVLPDALRIDREIARAMQADY